MMLRSSAVPVATTNAQVPVTIEEGAGAIDAGAAIALAQSMDFDAQTQPPIENSQALIDSVGEWGGLTIHGTGQVVAENGRLVWANSAGDNQVVWGNMNDDDHVVWGNTIDILLLLGSSPEPER